MSKLDIINNDLNRRRKLIALPEPVVVVTSLVDESASEGDTTLLDSLDVAGGEADIEIKTVTYNQEDLIGNDAVIIQSVEKYQLANTSVLGKGSKVDGQTFLDGQIIARGNTESSTALIQLQGKGGVEGLGTPNIKAIGTSLPIAVTDMQDTVTEIVNTEAEAITKFYDSLPPVLGAPAGGFLGKALKIAGAAGFSAQFAGFAARGNDFIAGVNEIAGDVKDAFLSGARSVAGTLIDAVGSLIPTGLETTLTTAFNSLVKKGKEWYQEFGETLDNIIRAGGEALGPLGDGIEYVVETLFPELKNPADDIDTLVVRDANGEIRTVNLSVTTTDATGLTTTNAINLNPGDVGFQEAVAAIGTDGNLNVSQFMETVAQGGILGEIPLAGQLEAVYHPLHGLFVDVNQTLGFNLYPSGEFLTFINGSTFQRLTAPLLTDFVSAAEQFLNNPLGLSFNLNDMYLRLLGGDPTGIVEMVAGTDTVSSYIEGGKFEWSAVINAAAESGGDPQAVREAIRQNGIENGASEEEINTALAAFDNATALAQNVVSPTIGGLLSDDDTPSAFDSDFELRIAKHFTYVSSLEELELEFATQLDKRKNDISSVVIHATETFTNKNIGAEEIAAINLKLRTEGFGGKAGERDIPYHYVIRRDGRLQRGKKLKSDGDHCAEGDYDKTSIGVVMVGGLDSPSTEQSFQRSSVSFTRAQYDTLEMFLQTFYNHVPGGEVFGHNDIEETELDPYFDVQEYIVSLFGRVNQTFAVAPETEYESSEAEFTPVFIPTPDLVAIEDIDTANVGGDLKPEYALQGTTNEFVNPDLLVAQIPKRLEIMCNQMGRRLKITSGYRTQAQGDAIGSSRSSLHRVGAAVDISRDGMSDGELQSLIEFGIKAGFIGIGIYNGHLHMDVGRKGAGKRCWGPNGSRTGLKGSQFAFARSILSAYGYATS